MIVLKKSTLADIKTYKVRLLRQCELAQQCTNKIY